ncbi:thymidylate synthase, partial [Candidatus Micrarchaeota archaeon CG11_big_fil_rev_8_21_14_0_20_47_5]
AHIACENISNVATKFLQDARIGISPLEKSTRYVYFNEKNEKGEYRYCREPKIMQSEFAKEYLNACNLLFETYCSLMEPVKKYVMEKNPQEDGVSERAYSATIRAKTCDILRCLLPASTLTNTGMYGNGRAFEYLIMKGYASELGEMREIAGKMQGELSKVIPSFVKRANDKYGALNQEYLKGRERKVGEEACRIAEEIGIGTVKTQSEPVVLVEYDENALEKVVCTILFPHLHCPLKEIKEKVKGMGREAKIALIDAYVGERKNRRHKPGRAFENVEYTFCICGNFGMYRDLHRHRILTQERQLLTTEHGFEMPKELVEINAGDNVHKAVLAADVLYKKMQKKIPREAQYVVPMGCKMQWYIKMNLREAVHFCELRSMAQGHRDYRKIAQEIYLRIKEVHPYFAEHMNFVDMKGEYSLERLESEKRIDKRMDKMQKAGRSD